MTTSSATQRDPRRLTAALRLVLRRYGAQLRRRRAIAIGALLLPAVADVLTFYAPPLVIAKLLGRFARNEPLTLAALTPYVLTFAALCWADRRSGASRSR